MTVTTSYVVAKLNDWRPNFITNDADVSLLPQGGYVIVGSHAGHVDTQAYAPGGGVTTGQNQNLVGSNATVATLNGGNYVVVDQDGDSIRYAVFSPTGTVIKAQTDIGNLDSDNATVAPLLNGGFVIFNHDFTGHSYDFLDTVICDAAGNIVQSFELSGGLGYDPAATELDNGDIALAYSKVVSGGAPQMWLTIISPDVQNFLTFPTAVDTVGANTHVSLAPVNNGFVAVYEDTGAGGGDITLARYDMSGALQFQIDLSDLYNPADGSADARPSVARIAPDIVAVTWDDNAAANTNPIIAMVDAETGQILAARDVLVRDNINDDVQNTQIAAVGGAHVVVVGDDVTTGLLDIETAIGRRVMTGDGANNTITATQLDLSAELIGMDGNDKLTGNVQDDLIYGGRGVDHEIGSAGSDALFGGDGNDKLDGGYGADYLFGDLGNDTYVVDNVADIVDESGAGGMDTVQSSVDYTLPVGIEKLELTWLAVSGTGNSGANTLIGNDQDNFLYGGGGNDKLDGAGGHNTLYGGAGNDTYTVRAGDMVVEASGGGTDTVMTALDNYTLGDNVEKLTLTGAAALNGNGNGLANTLTGNAGANVLKGLGGADQLKGGGGDDWLYGGAGADKLTGNGGADHFVFDNIGGVDTVLDFVSGADQLVLDKTVFTAFAGLASGAHIAAGDFATGTAATTTDQNIVYDSATGRLYYDRDGLGGAAQVQIAVLTGHPALVFTDVHIL